MACRMTTDKEFGKGLGIKELKSRFYRSKGYSGNIV